MRSRKLLANPFGSSILLRSPLKFFAYAMVMSGLSFGESPPEKAFAFMVKYCSACHGAESEAAGGFGVAHNLQELVKQNYVIPGKPEHSPVFIRVSDESMPLPGSPKPKPNDILNLKEWILEGAQPMILTFRNFPWAKEQRYRSQDQNIGDD